MKKLVILSCLLLSACFEGHVDSIPAAPSTDKVINNDVPVPVLCKVEIKKQEVGIDSAKQGMDLENQNAMLRSSMAEMKSYINILESNIVGCGGKITH